MLGGMRARTGGAVARVLRFVVPVLLFYFCILVVANLLLPRMPVISQILALACSGLFVADRMFGRRP